MTAVDDARAIETILREADERRAHSRELIVRLFGAKIADTVIDNEQYTYFLRPIVRSQGSDQKAVNILKAHFGIDTPRLVYRIEAASSSYVASRSAGVSERSLARMAQTAGLTLVTVGSNLLNSIQTESAPKASGRLVLKA